MFLHLSVSHSVHRGGVSQHALGQIPPWADISQHALGQTPPRQTYPPGQTYPSIHWGRHIRGAASYILSYTSPAPKHIQACTGADTSPPGQTYPSMYWSRHPLMATAAYGMHPTGMHSCCRSEFDNGLTITF